MAWTARKIVFRARSSVHVGNCTLGYIKLTRSYITGRAMWGAATASLTRTFGNENNSVKEYSSFGEILANKIIFSYFYPAIDKIAPLTPCITENGLMYGDEMAEAEFQHMFIGSYGQTAIEPDSNTAEYETLHESEYIRHKVIDNKNIVQGVFFVGYVFINENAQTRDGRSIGWSDSEIDMKKALTEIFIGGDIRCGWGRLELLPGEEELVDEIFGHNFTPNHKNPVIEMAGNKPIPAHLIAENGFSVRGDIEPMVGRIWCSDRKKGGAGRKVQGEDMCWMPGSVMINEFSLAVGEHGVLCKETE